MRLKELREEKNYTQKYIAEQIGATQPNIGRWEKGENEPSTSYLVKLANFFGCTIDYLVGRSDDFGNVVVKNETQPLTDNEKAIVELIHDLPSFYQVQVIEYAKYIAEKQGTVKQKNIF